MLNVSCPCSNHLLWSSICNICLVHSQEDIVLFQAYETLLYVCVVNILIISWSGLNIVYVQ